MTNIEIIKDKVEELEKLAKSIVRRSKWFFDNVPISPKKDKQKSRIPFQNTITTTYYIWDNISDNRLRRRKEELISDYTRWFNSAKELIEDNLNDRMAEFINYYERNEARKLKGVLEYLDLRERPLTNDREKLYNDFRETFYMQRAILTSIEGVLETRELKLKDLITADLLDKEIEQAEELFDKGYERAACAIAGVVFESYLENLCDKHSITYTDKDTIEPKIQKLYRNHIIDKTELKKYKFLGGIRNDCDHPDDIDSDDIRQLLEEVKKLI